LVGSLVRELRADRGWETDLAVGSIAGRWAELVGAEIAEHCRPERLDGGDLVLVAESSAWATQLQLLAGTIRQRLRDELGADVVRRISVHGPAAPSWRKGPWRVVGRGPRDTYG
jgi:predicted nucleic acid-binding Zn ribbon protein